MVVTVSQWRAMRARSALFDLYGDHLRARGGQAPIAALVRLLAPLGIAGPAVRTAVSRMVRQGWLAPVRLASGPGYALTAKAVRRLDDAAGRIYRTTSPSWDGRFDLIMINGTGTRTLRARLRSSLAYLGYGSIDDRTWIAPRPHEEVATALAEIGVSYYRFRASHVGDKDEAAELVRRAWDLPGLAAAYQGFVDQMTPVVEAAPTEGDDETAYRARFELVHAWRAFLFRDPQLPPDLLPDPWPGTTAATFFDRSAARLRPAADRFVSRCLET